MNATLLILLFAQQGYWISGQEQTISIAWAAKDPAPPAAELQWELGLRGLKLDSGTARLEPGGLQTAIKLKAPQVRVRTSMKWAYRLVQLDGKKVLETGERTINVFPADLTADWARRVGERKLVVWDNAAGKLTHALDAAKVPYSRVDDLTKIFDRPDLLLVAPDCIGASGLDQGPLIAFAKAGSSVAVLSQPVPERLAGYAVHQREPAGSVQFRSGHPLFDRLEPADLASWMAVAGKSQLPAIQLPRDEPALELAWWPRETPGETPAPIEALIVSKTIGGGRILLCQQPLGAWDSDPRSQLFLGNLLSYVTTRPEPTPPPIDRRESPAPATQPVPTIDFSSGAKS